MNFDSFVGLVRTLPFVDLAMIIQLAGGKRSSLLTQIYRWERAGKLVMLRRGVYVLADTYRHVAVNPAELANHLYRPSYLSGLWALGYHGLIPEKVVTYTSVTTRVPRRFENVCGVFEYRHLKPAAFFGYRPFEIQNRKVLLADPEKALLDLWHLGSGSWSGERMREMRFQNHKTIAVSRLKDYARRFASPRLLRAVTVWLETMRSSNKGTINV